MLKNRGVLLGALVISSLALAQGKSDEKKPQAAKDAKELGAEKGGGQDKQELKGAADSGMAAAQAMPSLPPEGRRWVDANRGKWKSKDVTMKMGGNQLTGGGQMDCDKAAGDWATVCKAKITIKGMPPMEAVFAMGWNMGDATAHLFELTNFAEVHDHRGKWTDDKNITLVHTGKNTQGKDETDSLTMTFVSPKEIAFKASGNSGGTETFSMTSTWKK